jgi:opacity protein-like surface antigen
MKKIAIGICVIILISGVSFAQENPGISAMGGLTFPTGDFGDVYGTGFGLKGVFQYPLNPTISITGTTGLMRWSDSLVFLGESLETSITTIPVLGGVRLFFAAGDIAPYANGEIGFHILTSKVSGFGESESDSNIEFGFGFGGGLLYALTSTLFLDANLQFNSISGDGSSLHFISLFVGIHIPF